MRALVFGSTGQDGSLLSRSLLAKGYHVIGVTRSGTPNLTGHKQLGIIGEVEFVTASITDFREVLELINQYNPDEIYNLAAQSSVALSFKQPLDTFDGIINGSINLLEVLRFIGYGGRVYFAGSSEIFGNVQTPADIASPRWPRSPYAIAKDASFNAVKVFREAYQLNCVTGILFNHESPLRPESFVTRKIILGALRCKRSPDHKLELGDLSVSRDWGWAEEYIEAMQLILRAPVLSDQVICTGRAETLQYFVEKTFLELSLNWRDHVVTNSKFRRPSDIQFSIGNPSAMLQQCGWQAQRDIDGVISSLLEAELVR